MQKLDEKKAVEIINKYCHRLWGHGTERSYAEKFKIKAGEDYMAFSLCTTRFVPKGENRNIQSAFNKAFPDIYDLKFGITKKNIYVLHKKKKTGAFLNYVIPITRLKTWDLIARSNPVEMDACHRKTSWWSRLWPF